jgi:hypothetical protein
VAPQRDKIIQVLKSRDVRNITRREKWGNESLELRTSVEEVHADGSDLSGVLRYDVVTPIPFRGAVQYVRQTIESKFTFDFRSKMRPFLIIFESNQDQMAGILNSAVFGNDRGISNGSISPDKLKEFAEKNSVRMPVVSWKGLDIPNLDKSVLSGADVAQTTDYKRYSARGNTYYVMMELRRKRWVVAISGEARAIMYTKVDPDDFLEFLKTQVTPMVS